jgi:hypothetical protein
MKPSRPSSNGRLAPAGSSLRVEMARIAANAPIVASKTGASQPPASMTSASPRRIISVPSPIAWPEDAQALVGAKFGPSAPKVMAAWPAAMFETAIGMKNGLSRSGPRVAHVPIWSMSVPVPPRPEPIMIPVPSASSPSRRGGSPASASASAVATSASCVQRSVRRISFRSRTEDGSNPWTSPAIRLPIRRGSKAPIVRTPERPSMRFCQKLGTSLPSGVTAPSPVITTRRAAGDALIG